ncbi:hypothetical protein C8R41DRAFT_915990 [Lentinula lateritia]|uniref:Uncharacterized protein n=1 Tax=Lentinula lateritia TaxID=40482 RepID=A0ABQ8VTF2_9AGAR|nr:hypothetical protein C8R41DRAFT_915990 [Lentinula lateritia]
MPAVTFPMLIDVTTTTVFASSPVTPTSSNKSSTSSVPVAAIAGGVTGGAVLAVAIVIAWIIWGRSIKRQKDELRITKHNTMKNASTFSKPRNYSYRPLFWPPSNTQVKFADESEKKSPAAANPTYKTPSRPKLLTPCVSFTPNTRITPSAEPPAGRG